MNKFVGIGLYLVLGLSVYAQDITTANDGVVDHLEELRDLFEEHQLDWVGLALPGDATLFQNYGLVVPFRTGQLPKKFVRRLVGEYNSDGIPVYGITCVEDFLTRQVVIYDTFNGTELWRLDADPYHDPFAYLRLKYDLSVLESFEGIDPWEILRLDSAKVAADFTLVPDAFYADYVLAEEQRKLDSALEASAMPMVMGLPATVSDIMVGITNSGGAATIQVKWPTSYSNRIEIFSCDNLASNAWKVESGKHTTIGKTEINWTDTDSTNLAFRAYRAGDADTDTDGDSYTDAREILVYGTSATTNDTDGDLLPDNLEIEKSYLNPTNPADAGWDYDGDGANNLDEYQFGTRMWDRDTDNDGLSDQELYHYPTLDPFNALASDRIPDTDTDGMPNGYEADNNLDAFNMLDKFGDRDGDGLDNYYEYTNGLYAGEADSDGDGLNDRAEMVWGMTDPLVYDDPFSDADGDGLLLVQEYTYGSDPANPHSDADGVEDGVEAAQGSQPADASDGGNAPEAGSQAELTIEIGDHSNSASESYTLYIDDIPFASVGTVVTHTYMIDKGATYTVTIEHDDTTLESGNGDHDYTANITGTETGTIILEDDNGILGIHGTPEQWDGTFDAEGLDAKLHVPKITLNLSKTTMTLKHDNQCDLEVITEPAGLVFSGHGFEIRHSSESIWHSLGTGTQMGWTTKVAGNFNIRAKVQANGQWYYSVEKEATVQFPSQLEILSGSGIIAAMETEWQETLTDSTPTSYREHGFIIKLNSQTGNYTVDTSRHIAAAVAPGVQAMGEFFVEWEDPNDTFPTSGGADYPVALFHTHPPLTYAPAGQDRDTGPSAGSDEDIDQAYEFGLSGFVYDYTAFTIYAGHPETDDHARYDYGPDPRTRP